MHRYRSGDLLGVRSYQRHGTLGANGTTSCASGRSRKHADQNGKRGPIQHSVFVHDFDSPVSGVDAALGDSCTCVARRGGSGVSARRTGVERDAPAMHRPALKCHVLESKDVLYSRPACAVEDAKVIRRLHGAEIGPELNWTTNSGGGHSLRLGFPPVPLEMRAHERNHRPSAR